jgi:CubicO group peptidase (beta-lactamase class C family)
MPPADLAERIPELMARARVPGLSVASIEDGRLTWSGAFGRKHRDSDEPVDTGTVFQAASLSKPVFAYAVLKLVERGVLTLDRPLASYLPASAHLDDALSEQVTARQVLCHMTGWPNWRPAGQPLRREAAPGARFGYSGEGYVYLQRCIEHVTGQPLDALVRATVFEPMGLPDSSYAWAAPRDAAVAAGHDRDGAPSARYVGEHPNAASSLHTTPRDFARFLAALLTVGNEPWRLGQASVSEMLRPQARIDERIAWGLGWGLAATAAGQSFWHWGDNPGYKCFAVALPATRTGVVVMTNGDGGLEVCAAIMRRMLAGDHPAFAWLSRRGWYQPSASPQGSRRQ